MMQNRLLEINRLKKYFPIQRGILRKTTGFVKAIDDVDLIIEKGQNLGLVGESGCGKTTLTRLIIKLMEADSGRIIFQNQDITNFSNKQLLRIRKDIQIVFQDPFGSLDPRFTVRKIIKEAFVSFKDLSREQIEERITKLVELVMLPSDCLNRYPYEFSGGERQRIAIARSLVSQPKLLILDEAVSNLDVIVQSQILKLLFELQRQFDLTYMFVSHNLRVVKKVCQKIAVMYLGKIVELAKTEQLFFNPLHPYSAALLEASVNLRPSLKTEATSITDIPSGCRFHPRCNYCQERCKKEKPRLIEHLPGHFAACHFPLGKKS